MLEHDADGIIPPLGPGAAGRLVRVNANGTQTVIASAGLVKPGGVTVGPDGAVYVTNRSIFAGTGEVVRIVPKSTRVRTVSKGTAFFVMRCY